MIGALSSSREGQVSSAILHRLPAIGGVGSASPPVVYLQNSHLRHVPSRPFRSFTSRIPRRNTIFVRWIGPRSQMHLESVRSSMKIMPTPRVEHRIVRRRWTGRGSHEDRAFADEGNEICHELYVRQSHTTLTTRNFSTSIPLQRARRCANAEKPVCYYRL